MAKKYLKKCVSSLSTRKMQIKTTLRFYLTLTRTAQINKVVSGKDGGGATVGGNVNWTSHSGKQCGDSSKR